MTQEISNYSRQSSLWLYDVHFLATASLILMAVNDLLAFINFGLISCQVKMPFLHSKRKQEEDLDQPVVSPPRTTRFLSQGII